MSKQLDSNSFVWRHDFTNLALEESARRRDQELGPPLPTPLCAEVGRRLLLAELTYSSWNLRRVEKVQFERDRSVSRRLSIDLTIREDAPVFRDAGGEDYWLVPLSTMRRRTLVNLDLRDEDGKSITLLGLRLAQRLDESVLLAAAHAAAADAGEPLNVGDIEDFIRQVVSGDRESIEAQMAKAEEALSGGSSVGDLGKFLRQPVFSEALAYFRRNFTLFVMLQADESRRHRVIRMYFDEPTDWQYQRPVLEPLPEHGLEYKPGQKGSLRWHRWTAALSLRATRVRFQVPSAENAASYHFEVEAPVGVRIVRATLLAGRPHQKGPNSVDEIVGHRPIVGLHAVEVPNDSLCRVQVDLRVPVRGWLSTLVVSCWVVSVVLAIVWAHAQFANGPDQWGPDQVTNIVLVLVTVTAGTATYVAQHAATGVAARMVTGLRAVGAVVIGFPAVEAVYLVLIQTGGTITEAIEKAAWPFLVVAIVSLFITGILTGIWWATRKAERRGLKTSPWDMTHGGRRRPSSTLADKQDFVKLVKDLGFDTPAIGVESAEGWHERYAWSPEQRRRAIEVLTQMRFKPSTSSYESIHDSCRCRTKCARADLLAPVAQAVPSTLSKNGGRERRRGHSAARGPQ